MTRISIQHHYATMQPLIQLGQQIRERGHLDPKLVELVLMRCSQINGCAFCLDMHSKDARRLGETEQRLLLLDAWREAPIYTPAERAALAWTEALTLVAQTHGYLGAMVPPPPAAEADSLRAWWLEKHHLPGALAVTNTDFWRLQDPDRRRIERTAANKTSYTFGPRWPAGGAYLVDRSGTIVDVVAPSDASAELRVSRLIAALFAQQTASR